MCQLRGLMNYLILFVTIFTGNFKAVDGLTIQCYKSTEEIVLGNNPFILSCEYNIGTQETLDVIRIHKQRSHGAIQEIVRFNESSGTVVDGALKLRTNLTSPTPQISKVSVRFADSLCTDEAAYRWLAVYNRNDARLTATATIEVRIKAETTFDESVPPLTVPNASLKEGDNVTFACDGDVGKLPVGRITFYRKYKGTNAHWTSMASEERSTNPLFHENTCSYRQLATLKMKLVREMNGMVIRCVVHQDTFGELGDKRRDTAPVIVQYPPVNVTVFVSAEDNRNQSSLALVCNSDSNPAPAYRWLIHHDKTIVDGSLLRIPNVTSSDSGKRYTCYVSNTINDHNYEISKAFTLNIPGESQSTISASPSMAKPAVAVLLAVNMIVAFF